MMFGITDEVRYTTTSILNRNVDNSEYLSAYMFSD